MKKVLAILILGFLYSVIAYGSDTTSGFKVKKRFTSDVFIQKNTKASTIILSHGSGGIWKHSFMWKDRLVKQGYNVVLINHHKEKGIKPHVGRRDYKDFP